MSAAAAPSGTTLVCRRVLAAPRERVFRAWTGGEQFQRWFTPPGGSSPRAELDVRVGGRFRVEMRLAIGSTRVALGTYVEITPPERLVFTLEWEGWRILAPGETLVTVEFHQRGDSTELVLIHERQPGRLVHAFHWGGWSTSLRKLERWVRAE